MFNIFDQYELKSDQVTVADTTHLHPVSLLYCIRNKVASAIV